MKERAAAGWDLRAKGYLPFYRNVAVTGAYSQWYGDHVGMFSSRDLEKDPKVWSYGLEYTPIPLVSGFVNQRSTEQGRSDTEFGLRFTYHFQMPWEDQISHAKVAELRTVSGSRHEFVDRENRIILEYKAKNKYRIEYVGYSNNAFVFRIRDGFDKYVGGQTVRVTAGGGVTLAEASSAQPQTLFAKAVNFLDELISVKAAYAAMLSGSYTSDGSGYVRVPGSSSGTVTLQAGDTEQTFTVNVGSVFSLSLANGTPNPAVGGTSSITATLTEGGTAASGAAITWTWKIKGGGQTQQAGASSTTDGSGQNAYTVSNTDTGQRTITVTATANGVSQSVDVQFGAALPSGFIALSPGTMDWATAGTYCTNQGGRLPKVNSSTSYPSSSYTGTEPVDGFGHLGDLWPSGLPSDGYWTGTEDSGGPGYSWIVDGGGGSVFAFNVIQSYSYRVVCVP